MELRKVDEKNLWDIVNLSVHDHQKSFVASNTKSILQAYVAITSGGIALPFGIYEEDTLVGFVMFGYGTYGEDDEPKVAENSYCLWRFMIGKEFQGKGLGKKALVTALEYIHTMPCGPAEFCWLAYEPENVVARKLYASFGFEENGEMCGDEVVAILSLHK